MAIADPNLVPDFQRYAGLIEAALRPPLEFTPEAENANAIQAERGAVYGRMLMAERGQAIAAPPAEVERLIEVASHAASMAVVDREGHCRPVYRPLMVYSWMMAFRVAYETLPREQFGRWEEGLRAWADLLEARLGQIALPGAGMAMASDGPGVAEACWIALALHAAGRELARDAWTDLAADVFGRLPHWQRESGAFLAAGPGDNVETLAYHELVILHAASSYAVQTENRGLAGCVARATAFHQQETEPNHATAKPWGLFAFAWNQATRPMADGLLHAANMQGGTTRGGTNRSGVSLMLLADALYCIRLFKVSD